MHFTRSASYPLAAPEKARLCTSPFSVHTADADKLFACEAFQVVRKYLAADQKSGFCGEHRPATVRDQEAWLLHRDITHALILPVLQILRRASQVATTILGPRTPSDLELAYRGGARDAFCWLQCFLTEEAQWFTTGGCPGCVVLHALKSAETVRLVLVACQLSQYLRNPNDQEKDMPMFAFWLESLKLAMETDTFWGPGYWEEIEPRAEALGKSVRELMDQCCRLEMACNPKAASHVPLTKMPLGEAAKPNVRVSAVAKQQMLLQREEEEWLRKMTLACWTSLLTDSKQQTRYAEMGVAGSTQYRLLQTRTRSLSYQ
ncbi:MAG: hypothetical protein M1814_005425 [Vezdaea aestivalis]|nr:MAG: hypothetical protein M1814_005425 [Vezdaea aestivalis]